MLTLTIHVGWTSVRPVQPDQHWSSVTVQGVDTMDCELTAHGMVAGRPECEMVTSILVTL